MTLSELPVKSEYRSDTDDFVRDFYVPCLSRSNVYWRAVGYFTSRGLAVAAQGVTALIKNDGRMSLVASPVLSREDQEAIKLGYAARDSIIEKSLLRQFEHAESMEDEDRLGYLAWMIAEQRLEVQIALPVASDNSIKDGIYHEKLGIFFDDSSNSIAFTGSPNETSGGLVQNFEAIDVFCSWEDPQNRVARKQRHFANLWSNETIGLQILSFPEAAKQALLQFRPRNRPDEESTPKGKRSAASPQALERWRHQDQALGVYLREERGVLNMATGTGKTRTALKILVELFERDEIDTANLLENTIAAMETRFSRFKNPPRFGP